MGPTWVQFGHHALILPIWDPFAHACWVVTSLHETVFRLEKSTMTQIKLDSANNDLCDVIKKEMVERLPKKHVKPSYSGNNKRRKVGKPWWSEE